MADFTLKEKVLIEETHKKVIAIEEKLDLLLEAGKGAVVLPIQESFGGNTVGAEAVAEVFKRFMEEAKAGDKSWLRRFFCR